MNVKNTVLLLILYLAGALAYLGARHIAAVTSEEEERNVTDQSFLEKNFRACPQFSPKAGKEESTVIFETPLQQDQKHFVMPHPAEPEDTTLPPSGKASLRALFGWEEQVHIHNSVCGFVSNPSDEVAYERQSGKTKVSFSSGWTITVDDATGAILVPCDLPALSDEELVDMTWRAFVANDGLERWRNIYRRIAEDGTVLSSLSDTKLDEIRRVGDKAFVAWRLVASPPAEDGSFLRYVYWVDVRSRKIVIEGEEINEY